MNTNMIGFEWFSKIFASLHPCALELFGQAVLALEGLTMSYIDYKVQCIIRTFRFLVF